MLSVFADNNTGRPVLSVLPPIINTDRELILRKLKKTQGNSISDTQLDAMSVQVGADPLYKARALCVIGQSFAAKVLPSEARHWPIGNCGLVLVGRVGRTGHFAHTRGDRLGQPNKHAKWQWPAALLSTEGDFRKRGRFGRALIRLFFFEAPAHALHARAWARRLGSSSGLGFSVAYPGSANFEC